MNNYLRSAVLLIAGVIISIQAMAQPAYYVGGGTSSNSFPFSTTGKKIQQLVKATNFNTTPPSGLITKVYFRSNTTASTTSTFTNLNILMKETTITSLPSGAWITGLTNVLSKSSYSVATSPGGTSSNNSGWVEFILDTPWPYDNTKPLIVEVNQTSTSNGWGTWHSTGFSGTRIYGDLASSNPVGLDGYLWNIGFEIISCSTAIIQQPVHAVLCAGDNIQFSSDAIDFDSVKWQVNEGAGFIDITDNAIYSGAKTKTLKVTGTMASMNGFEYRMNAINNPCSVFSDSAVLTVNDTVTTPPLAAFDTTCIGAMKYLAIGATGLINSYRWQIFIPGKGYIDVPPGGIYSMMGDTLLINGVPDTLNGSIFRVIVDGVCDIDTSNDLSLTVNTVPKVGTPPVDIVINQGDDATFEVIATASPAKYRWQAAGKNDTFAFINDNAIYSGVKTSKLTVHSATRAQNEYRFRCVVYSGTACIAPGDSSAVAVMYVNPTTSVQGLTNHDGSVVVYPNPAGGNSVFLQVDGFGNYEQLRFRITDQAGKVISIGNVTKGNTEVDIHALPKGMYYLELVDSNRMLLSVNKFIRM